MIATTGPAPVLAASRRCPQVRRDIGFSSFRSTGLGKGGKAVRTGIFSNISGSF